MEKGHQVLITFRDGKIIDPKFILNFDETALLVSNVRNPDHFKLKRLVFMQDIRSIEPASGYNPDHDAEGNPVDYGLEEDYDED